MSTAFPESDLPNTLQDEDFTLTPDEATKRLENLGYTPDTWDAMLADTTGSHFTRSLVTIARGEKSRDINEVYHELYSPSEKEHVTSADIEAARNADLADVQGKWEAFVKK
jgi:hypothetical protein